MENLYRILNVAPTASAEEIKKAISRELRIWTNRTNAPLLERRQEAERMVKLLQDAETKLLDANKRAEYDRQLASESIKPIDQPSFEKIYQSKGLSLFEEAQDLLLKGKVADALVIATQAVQQDNSNSENWALRGLVNFEWSEIENAIFDFQQAISLRPNVAFYYFELGNVYESIEQWDNALLQYQRATRIEPQTIMYQAAIGGLLTVIGQYQDSIRILEQCVQAEPQNVVYQWFLARAYVASSDGCLTFIPPESVIATESNISGGYYATAKQQVMGVVALVEKAESLKLDDGELESAVMQTKMDIRRMERRHFHGNKVLIGINVAFGLLFILFDRGFAAYLLICSGLYIASCMTPQYVLNRIAITGKDETSEGWFKKILAFLWTGRGISRFIAISVFLYIVTLFLLPIMVVWNFVKNYILVR